MRASIAVAHLLAAGFVATTLGGCGTPVRTLPGLARTLPLVVVSKGLGGVLRGSIRIDQLQGSYLVSRGTFSCSGTYTLSRVDTRMYVPILCNDGRKGTADVLNGQSFISGSGSLTMADGSTGKFLFGEDTKKFQGDTIAQ